MPTIQTSFQPRKQKHSKRKDKYRHQINLGNPKVPLGNKQYKQNHELLSDWENAS